MVIQAANLAGFRASVNPRFEAGIPDFMNGILNFSIHFNVVHRKVDWRNPKMKSLNSMPVIAIYVVVCIDVPINIENINTFSRKNDFEMFVLCVFIFCAG